jgi:hypothetical protein
MMNAQIYRSSLRQMLYDAAHQRERTSDAQAHGWLNNDSAHALERIADQWPYTETTLSRAEVSDLVRSELSKTDNSLLRAMDLEKLTECILQLEELK